MSRQAGGWDALDRIVRLQDAVVAHDRDSLEAWVSERMIWVLPQAHNTRGKHDWIDASCSITWNWFDVRICREIDLGGTRLVEAWIRQQREPTEDELAQGTRAPIAAEGVVVDLWAVEDGDWRLIARHPQRAQD